jgi:WD40 repeat protein
MTEDGRFLFLEEHSGKIVPWELIREWGGGGCFSPDLRWFTQSHEPGVVTVWDVREALSGSGPPQRRATLTGALMSYHKVIFTPDNRRVAASSGLSQMVTLWDTESFESVLTLAGKGWGTLQIACSPDGNTLISGGDLLHIWTAPSWEEIAAVEAERQGKETNP